MPLARWLDDVVERKTYVHPALTVGDDVPAELVQARPYCTVQSGLAFAVTEQ